MARNEHVYATSYRPEAAGDVIYSDRENVKTIDRYALLNFEAASVSIFSRK